MTIAVTLLLAAAAWVAHLADPDRRRAFAEKPFGDWILDGANLVVQGVGVPVFAAVLVGTPSPSMQLPPFAAFLLAFVGVDYLYYWNHRLLHTAALWRFHRVHHTATRMDIFATSRNTVWSTWLVLYVWTNAWAAATLMEPAPFLLGAATTAGLDVWRHSALQPPPALARRLRGWLILPDDHARHHADDAPDANYGANFAIWDRLHGTWSPTTAPPARLGLPDPRAWWRRLLVPESP